MFGKPEWFELSSSGKLPIPARRAGWLYYATWLAAVVLPTVLLGALQLIPEAPIWLVIASVAGFLDVRSVRRRAMEAEAFAKLHYIDDSADEPVETGHYQMHVRGESGV